MIGDDAREIDFSDHLGEEGGDLAFRCLRRERYQVRIEIDPILFVFAQFGDDRFIVEQEGQDSGNAAEKDVRAENRRRAQTG